MDGSYGADVHLCRESAAAAQAQRRRRPRKDGRAAGFFGEGEPQRRHSAGASPVSNSAHRLTRCILQAARANVRAKSTASVSELAGCVRSSPRSKLGTPDPRHVNRCLRNHFRFEGCFFRAGAGRLQPSLAPRQGARRLSRAQPPLPRGARHCAKEIATFWSQQLRRMPSLARRGAASDCTSTAAWTKKSTHEPRYTLMRVL